MHMAALEIPYLRPPKKNENIPYIIIRSLNTKAKLRN